MRDCWVLVGFGPDPYCPQRPSCRPLARADLCPWACFLQEVMLPTHSIYGKVVERAERPPGTGYRKAAFG